MSEPTKMKCPNCGEAMNHHADKVDYSGDAAGDSDFGGVFKEVHCCPSCGRTAVRTAS